MAKKIKFGLEMASGYTVRKDLEELRDHFDPVKALEHFSSGKLAEWLEDRYYHDVAEKIRYLDKDAPGFQRHLCEALGVEPPSSDLDVDQISRTNEKKTLLRQKTSDEAILAHAAHTAFDREDLVALWDDGVETIYLCGDAFDIPSHVEDTKYIGILGTPKITIKAKSAEELTDKGIVFENVKLPWEQEPSEKMDTMQLSEHSDNNGCIVPMEQLKEIFNSIYAGFLEKHENDKIFEGRENIGIWDVMNLEQKQHYTEECNSTKKAIVLNLICKGKYTEDDLIHVRVSKDFKAGWAFTKDSFCYGGVIGNGIIQYQDIDKVSITGGSASENGLYITKKDGNKYKVDGWVEGSAVLTGVSGKAMDSIKSYLDVVSRLYEAMKG